MKEVALQLKAVLQHSDGIRVPTRTPAFVTAPCLTSPSTPIHTDPHTHACSQTHSFHCLALSVSTHTCWHAATQLCGPGPASGDESPCPAWVVWSSPATCRPPHAAIHPPPTCQSCACEGQVGAQLTRQVWQQRHHADIREHADGSLRHGKQGPVRGRDSSRHGRAGQQNGVRVPASVQMYGAGRSACAPHLLMTS